VIYAIFALVAAQGALMIEAEAVLSIRSVGV
jgi:hypothetical protein